jgi:hypothetical protein
VARVVGLLAVTGPVRRHGDSFMNNPSKRS